MSDRPRPDPVLAPYFAKYPEAIDEALASLDKVDGRSVNAERECKIICWRLAEKIANSGLTRLTQQEIYEHLKRITEL